MVERVRALVLEHSAYGFNRIELVLALECECVSSTTVQKSGTIGVSRREV